MFALFSPWVSHQNACPHPSTGLQKPAEQRDEAEQSCFSSASSLSSCKQRATGTCPAPARLNASPRCSRGAAALLMWWHGTTTSEPLLNIRFCWVSLLNARAPGFHREPCTMTKWWAGDLCDWDDCKRSGQTSQHWTCKVNLKDTHWKRKCFWTFLLVFFFPAGTVNCRGPRQKPSLQIKAICFTLLSCKRHGCRRSSCETGLHNYCNLQFYESVDPKFLHSKRWYGCYMV